MTKLAGMQRDFEYNELRESLLVKYQKSLVDCALKRAAVKDNVMFVCVSVCHWQCIMCPYSQVPIFIIGNRAVDELHSLLESEEIKVLRRHRDRAKRRVRKDLKAADAIAAVARAAARAICKRKVRYMHACNV